MWWRLWHSLAVIRRSGRIELCQNFDFEAIVVMVMVVPRTMVLRVDRGSDGHRTPQYDTYEYWERGRAWGGRLMPFLVMQWWVV